MEHDLSTNPLTSVYRHARRRQRSPSVGSERGSAVSFYAGPLPNVKTPFSSAKAATWRTDERAAFSRLHSPEGVVAFLLVWIRAPAHLDVALRKSRLSASLAVPADGPYVSASFVATEKDE
jgi:hypothetical protein